MHKYDEYKVSRTSWGIGVLGSIFVKLTASDGTVGYATGFGGPPACWLIEEHYRRFIIGKDPRDTNMIWDQMFRASMFYGRKGESRGRPSGRPTFTSYYPPFGCQPHAGRQTSSTIVFLVRCANAHAQVSPSPPSPSSTLPSGIS